MVKQNVQFDWLPDKDPNAYITNFLEVFYTFKINGASKDAIKLLLFLSYGIRKVMSYVIPYKIHHHIG